MGVVWRRKEGRREGDVRDLQRALCSRYCTREMSEMSVGWEEALKGRQMMKGEEEVMMRWHGGVLR